MEKQNSSKFLALSLPCLLLLHGADLGKSLLWRPAEATAKLWRKGKEGRSRAGAESGLFLVLRWVFTQLLLHMESQSPVMAPGELSAARSKV